MRRALACLALLLATGCAEPWATDAGDRAFASRATTLMWGRRTLSEDELSVLTRLAARDGRGPLIRAMARSPEYAEHQADLLLDFVRANRTGWRAAPAEWSQRTRVPDGDLSAALRDADPQIALELPPFTIADLLADGLVADDLGPFFRAWLFSAFAVNLQPLNLDEELSQRRTVAQDFQRAYLGRDLSCLPCHNGAWSVTGSDDPRLDRTWEIPGRFEAAMFGRDDGLETDALAMLFRRWGVLEGHLLATEPAPATTDAAIDGCAPAEGWAGCAGCACEAAVCADDPACCELWWDDACSDACAAVPGGCGARLPDEADGCRPVFGSEGLGCGGCACEAEVCAQDPACCADGWDPACVLACTDAGGCDRSALPTRPWGAVALPALRPPSGVLPDVARLEGFLGGARGVTGSMWDVEALLRAGNRAARDGVEVADDGRVDPAPAFAWLLAQSLADRVWTQAFGAPLTLAHGFPRNEAQRDRLRALTEAYTASGSSLVAMLEVVATDPLFNEAAPAEATADLPLPPVFDPYSVENELEDQRNNGLGDSVHRLPARTMLRAARRALDWPRRPTFFASPTDPEASFQAGIGAFVQDAMPGFSGIGFQALLTWEAAMASCRSIRVTSTQPGCFEAAWPGCPDCDVGCEGDGCTCDPEIICSRMPACCEQRWGPECVEACSLARPCTTDGFAIDGDWIDAVVAGGGDARWSDALAAITERLVGGMEWGADERGALAILAGADLDAPLLGAGPEAASDGLRRICGALLSSPQFLLDRLPPPDPSPRPTLRLPGDDFAGHCARLSDAMFDGGLDCGSL